MFKSPFEAEEKNTVSKTEADRIRLRKEKGLHFVFDNYENFCRTASEDDEIFNAFKAFPIYHNIVGLHNEGLAIEYIKNIQKQNPGILNYSYLSVACKNDTVGSPLAMLNVKHKETQENFPIDLVSFQYVNTLCNLISHFSNLEKVKKIVEVGAGWGGQARKILAYKDCEYYTCDLPGVNLLVERMCSDINVTTFCSDTIPDNDYDLFISDYAFTECPAEVQQVYLDKIISRSKMGYITSNANDRQEGHMRFDKIVEAIKSMHDKVYVLPEVPATKSFCKVIVWGSDSGITERMSAAAEATNILNRIKKL